MTQSVGRIFARRNEAPPCLAVDVHLTLRPDRRAWHRDPNMVWDPRVPTHLHICTPLTRHHSPGETAASPTLAILAAGNPDTGALEP